MDDTLGLYILMGTDSSAIRLNHTVGLMQKLLIAQRKSMLDVVFGLVGGYVGLANLFTFFQFPRTAYYVLALSVIFLVSVGYFWWWRERREKMGHSAFETVVQFGIHLDEMRRYFRQWQVAKSLSVSAASIEPTIEYIRKSVKTANEGLLALWQDLKKIDYFTLGEDRESLKAEVNDICTKVLGGPPNTTTQLPR